MLVVEDNEINQQVAKELLEGAGLLVTVATDGQEAVKAVREGEYDAVLMDVQMPVMDGYEATAEIRRNPRFGDLPIIAITAHAMVGEREKALEMGMNDHVAKPLDPKEMFNALARWIQPGERQIPSVMKPTESHRSAKDEEPMPKLPGIDMEGGLARVGGNRKAFRRLLAKFAASHAGVGDEIEAALQEREMELARRLVHGLKGVSGNLGADDLYAVARELESAIEQGDYECYGPLLDALRQSLKGVLSSIAALEAPEKGWVPSEGESGKPVDFFKVVSMLQEIEGLLKRNDFQASAYLESLRETLRGSETQGELDRLERLVARYDFQGALEVLPRISEVLGI